VTSPWTIVTALDAIARFTRRGPDPNVESADGDAGLATDRLSVGSLIPLHLGSGGLRHGNTEALR
jgi:hypothetical protein